MILKLGIQYQVLKYYQIHSNDDPRLTFDFLRKCHILLYVFIREKAWTKDFPEIFED